MSFLSNASWIAPQIDYLVWLQNLRGHTGGIFNQLFLNITLLGQLVAPTTVMCIIYWCFDSKFGMYLFSLNGFSLLCTQIIKMTACVYRPWILSDKVKPLEQAFRGAAGYSFPSGHTTMAASTIGGLAYGFRKYMPVCIILAFLVLLVGFSRNYLGVHTPQDIIVGLLVGITFIFTVDKFINWLEKDKNRYLYFLGIFNLLLIITGYYLCTKNYPTDYVNGEILVKPQKAIYDSLMYYGWIGGIINGAFLCRRFFPFEAKEGVKISTRIIRGVVGLLLSAGMFYAIDTYFFGHIRNHLLTLCSMFSIGFFITAIYPWTFSLFKSKKEN